MERIIYTGSEYCAVQENGKLVEYIARNDMRQGGDIILGKIERMMPGLGCAFTDIGRKTSGFLPLKENSSTFSGDEIRSGMKIPVQVRKEGNGTKGAFLSRDLTIAGRYVLLMPLNRHIGVSSRITGAAEKEALRETGERIARGRFGIVMRAAAAGAEESAVIRETGELYEKWLSVREAAGTEHQAGFVLLHQDPAAQLIADYETKGVRAVIEAETLPGDLSRQLRAAGDRKVSTENGGNIVIDRCEAMTVIDVNTASSKPEGSPGELFLRTNLSACAAIAEQVRLRDIGGIIIIDFIDMDSEEDRNTVSEKLREVFACDRRKTVLHGWTNLGLMEMTRKRT